MVTAQASEHETQENGPATTAAMMAALWSKAIAPFPTHEKGS